MPRRMQEIVDQADELAQLFEDYEPKPEDRLDVSELTLVQLAAYKRAQAERELLKQVCAARAAGVSWAKLGAALGTSGEAARQKYSHI